MTMSLQTRLLLGITLGTAVLLTIFSVAVYAVTQQTMIHHFDRSLLGTARMLSAVIEDEGIEHQHEHDGQSDIDKPLDSKTAETEIEFEFDVRMTPEFNTLNGGGYYQIWDQSGKSLARSPSLGNQEMAHSTSASDAPEYRNIMLLGNKPGRAVSYCFLPRSEDEPEQDRPQSRMLTLVLARNTTEINNHLHFLKWLLAGASVGVVFLSTGVAFLITRTGLRPVHSLAAAITSVHEDNLGYNFSSEQYPAELTSVCQCLNDVFGRLEESFRREKQFNANVAHELRTPLAGMRSTIEVCLAHERQNAEYRNAFEDCLQITIAMNKMIDTLLTLSKLDADQVSVQSDSVDLKTLVDETWRFFADKAHDKNIVFTNSIATDTVCRTDKDRFAMILSNLLENAAEYTDRTGRIWTDIEQTNGLLTLSISNTGCCLTQADAERIFDVFWRKDTARSDVGRHCGIGLSVAQKIAAILRITLDVNIDADIFTVRLSISNELS